MKFIKRFLMLLLVVSAMLAFSAVGTNPQMRGGCDSSMPNPC